MKKIAHMITCLLLVLLSVTASFAKDPGWPRELLQNGTSLVYYQPQIDDWHNYRELDWRMAISLTPPGEVTVLGIVEMRGQTVIDYDSKMVLISGIKVKKTSFPSLEAAQVTKMDQLTKSFLPQTLTISLDRLVAAVPKKKDVQGVELKHAPPEIFISYQPAILLDIDGQPVRVKIQKTGLEYVINTRWPLFYETSSATYYLLAGTLWMQATDLRGLWSVVKKLPGDMKKLPKDARWQYLGKYLPASAPPDTVVPRIFYSTMPAEIILFEGKPEFASIPGTALQYVTNTMNYVFFHIPTGQFYYLTSGRWFRADTLAGPWMYATPDLPPDFVSIPPSSPAGQVLASVPGTDEAKDAVLLAKVPTTVIVNPATAAKTVTVTYNGSPQFVSIQGTTLFYATNTSHKVIKVGDLYYLCYQGIWFLSTNPQGPWQTAQSVPQVIYTIPTSSPVYNVIYVTQTVTPTGYVQASYTSGYTGVYVTSVSSSFVITVGTGYYYPPYIVPYPVYGFPVYYPPPCTYGYVAHYQTPAGAYGVSQTAFGPYGSATRTASYNPYTGTYARTASVSAAYGSVAAGRAYNPYTGGYAATKQGSNAYSSWGSSVVSKGGETAYTHHETTSRGTAASVQTSSGGKSVATKTDRGSSSVTKTGSGDIYAGHDGNVYKKTDSGWEKYNNGSWSSVQQPASGGPRQQTSVGQQTLQQHTPTAYQGGAEQMQNLQNEAQSRQRGEQASQRSQLMQSYEGAGRSAGRGGWRRR